MKKRKRANLLFWVAMMIELYYVFIKKEAKENISEQEEVKKNKECEDALNLINLLIPLIVFIGAIITMALMLLTLIN